MNQTEQIRLRKKLKIMKNGTLQCLRPLVFKLCKEMMSISWSEDVRLRKCLKYLVIATYVYMILIYTWFGYTYMAIVTTKIACGRVQMQMHTHLSYVTFYNCLAIINCIFYYLFSYFFPFSSTVFFSLFFCVFFIVHNSVYKGVALGI